MVSRRLLKNLDYTLISVTGLLILVGLVAIGSATTDYGWWVHLGLDINKLQEANIWQLILWMKKKYVLKQLAWVLLGIVTLAVAVYIPYQEWRKYTTHIYVFNLLLLVAVLLFGESSMGAQRWIFGFQPSEFSKLVVIIALAHFLSSREGRLRTWKELLPVFAFVGAPTVLTMLQPDLGTSLVFVAVLFGMLLVASDRPLFVGSIFGGGFLALVGMIWAHLKFGTWVPLQAYQLKRLIIFLDPWSDIQGAGYHIIQSQIAIGSSGFWGKGLLQGTQSFLEFLPIRHTDFIFSVLAEEFGFLGVLLVLTLFGTFLYRGVRIAAESRDLFGTLVAVGLVSLFAFQILINIGMTMAIMPITGLPLPFLSYGGSSMIASLTAVGILLNIYLHRQKKIF